MLPEPPIAILCLLLVGISGPLAGQEQPQSFRQILELAVRLQEAAQRRVKAGKIAENQLLRAELERAQA